MKTQACSLAACWLVVLSASAGNAQMKYPLSAVAAPSGEIYVADRNLPGVWLIKDGKLTSFFQGPKQFRKPLNAIWCVALDADGKLLAGDSATREVYRFSDAGEASPLTKTQDIGIPISVAVNKQGDIFAADLESSRIWKIAKAGGKPEVFATVPAPRGIFADSQDQLWVVSHGKDQLVRVDKEGKVSVVVKGRPFKFPHTVVVDDEENAFVCDGYAKTIWKVAKGSEKPAAWCKSDDFVNPVGLTQSKDGLLVVDPRAKAVFQVDKDGAAKKLELN